MDAKIHSIETMGALDGPGLRYVLFLHGCPLRCVFCHNPDTWASNPSYTKTSDEVFEDVIKYAAFFKSSGGGFTASGGEPLLQADFLCGLFEKLKRENIHTAIDTCGYADISESVKKLVSLTDLFLFDIKHLDSATHKDLTTKDNGKIIKFLRYIDSNNKEIHIRIVVISGVSDSAEYAMRLAGFLKEFKNIKKIDILPYHTLGVHKWENLNIPYKLKNASVPAQKNIEKMKDIFESNGFQVTVQ